MRITSILIFCLFLWANVNAQINYQTVVRDASGAEMTNQDFNFTVEILQDGNVVYSEEHNDINSGSIGQVNFKIGTGDNPSMPFDEVYWGSDSQIRISLNGQQMGISDVTPVPLAEYARNGMFQDGSGGDRLDFSGANGSSNVVIGAINDNSPNNGVVAVRDEDGNNRIVMHVGANESGNVDFSGANGNSNVFIGGLNNNNPDNGSVVVRSPQGENRIAIYSNPNANSAGLINVNGPNGSQNVTIASSGENFGAVYVKDGNSTIKGTFTSSSSSGGSGYFQTKGEQGTRNVVIGVTTGSNDRGAVRVFDENNAEQVTMWVNNNGEGVVTTDRTNSKCISITGGCDIKEDLNSNENLEAGDVVIIDAENEGQIKKTSTAYDKKVAGVISGAGGINSGLSLSQEGVMEGEYPLAMVGRVYVKVIGKVEAGDMLTTSTKSGFAMTAQKRKKSHGAIIGKAMSANDNGEGLVLVLLNLQ